SGVSAAGKVLRAHHGGDRVVFVDGRGGRRGERYSPGRTSRRLCVPQERPHQSNVGAEIPLFEMEDQSRPQEVRRVLRRPRRRCEPASALTQFTIYYEQFTKREARRTRSLAL